MSIEHALIQACRKFSVVIIDGPRCQEKTELVKQIFPEKPYLTLSNEHFRNLLSQSPKSFFMAFKDGVVIDQAQIAENAIVSVIHEITKTGYCPGKFILIYNGFASFEDPQKIAVKLTYLPTSKTLDTPFREILNGFIPNQDELIEDALLKINISNKDKFVQFLSLCAKLSGGQFSSGLISKKLSISIPTAIKWFELLIVNAIVIPISPSELKLEIKPYSKPFFVFSSSAYLCKLLNINTESDLILSENLEKIVFSYSASTLIKYRFNQGLPGNITYFKDRNNQTPVLIADWKHRWIFSVNSNLEASHLKSKSIGRLKTKFENTDTKTAVLYLGDLSLSYEKTEWISYMDWEKLASGLNYFS